jgi:hypothetical protein
LAVALVTKERMLSRLARALTYLSALLFALLGLPLFVAPAALAPVFAWKVSAFITMTIGAWCLGNAWLAWVTARRWQARLVYVALLYLWLFGAFELAIVVAFRSKLALAHPIAWRYLAALLVSLLSAITGLAAWVRRRPGRAAFGPGIGPGQRLAVLGFVVFVGFLAAYGLVAPVGAPGTNGGIFPEVMSAFTLRSFAAFYLALALATVPLLFEPSLQPLLHYAYAAFGLIVIITAAAFAFFGLFDLSGRPGGLIYFGAYFAVGIPVFIGLLRYGTGNRVAAPPFP